ncbi:MAG: hypothetical protein NT014_06720 [Candidatus Omnitrophica bacterium]|nr:hypothetical protein [Candidatus Omnitrophota bacterium]
MRIAVFIFLTLLFYSPCLAKNIPEPIKDSKPGRLSIADGILLKPVVVRMGLSRMPVLVNRFSGKVEYVWSNIYKCYVRPKYTMTNAQALYNQYHE